MEEQINPNAKPLVVNKKTGVLYRYEGNNLFTNLSTKKQGTLDDEKAKEIFNFPLELNLITLKYPNVEQLLIKAKMNIQINSENGIKNYII
jgi:hypothetical protein